MTPTFVMLTPLDRRCCINGVRMRGYAGVKIDGSMVAAWIADVHAPIVFPFETEQHRHDENGAHRRE